jgi:hypothetical protein
MVASARRASLRARSGCPRRADTRATSSVASTWRWAGSTAPVKVSARSGNPALASACARTTGQRRTQGYV